MEDAIIVLNGYSQRQDDQWLHTREVAYMIYCTATEPSVRETIYEFMRLPGDPTKEEIRAAKKAVYKKKVERQKEKLKVLVDKGVIQKPKKR